MALGKISPRDVDAKQCGDRHLHLWRDLKLFLLDRCPGIRRRERSSDPALAIAVLQPCDVQLIGGGELRQSEVTPAGGRRIGRNVDTAERESVPA
jgi:hypothetical protein